MEFSSVLMSVECVNICNLTKGDGNVRSDCSALSCAWKAPRALTGFLASTAHPPVCSLYLCGRSGRKSRVKSCAWQSYEYEVGFSEVHHFVNVREILSSRSSCGGHKRCELYCLSSESSGASYDVTIETLWEDLFPAISYLSCKELEFVQKGLKLAFEAHDGQKRRSGEPFIIHPVAVALSVECVNICNLTKGDGNVRSDCNALSCAWKAPRALTGFLASTAHPPVCSLYLCGRSGRKSRVKSCAWQSYEYEVGFSEVTHFVNVRKILSSRSSSGGHRRCELYCVSSESSGASDDVTIETLWEVSKLGKLKCKTDTESIQDVKADDLRQMFLAMTDEVRVIIVKLADRLHNMRTLCHMPPHKQSSIAAETLQVFAPLAKLLGMYSIKSELENLSFMYVSAEDYEKVTSRIANLYKEHEKELTEANRILVKKIEDDQFLDLVTVNTDVRSVCKETYSIYKAALKSKGSIDDYNQIAQLRIVVKPKPSAGVGPLCSPQQICYHVLGLVHEIWKPIPRTMKDYIATPKPNGYQSLHTTVIPFLYESMFRLEIQIRTEEMDLIAERGIAVYYNGRALSADISRLQSQLSKAEDHISKLPEETPFFEFEYSIQGMGFEKGWGDTAGRVLEMMYLLSDILQAPDPSSLEKFLGMVPMVFNVVILSPHGYFGQANVLGLPDTGGQVVYILDQVRALETEMLLRIKRQGLDITPRILIVTRLIPDAKGTTCNQRLERVSGTEHTHILRVPFRSDKGILRKWISRFDVWPYLENYAQDAASEIVGELQGVPDFIIGNYSDGNLVASLMAHKMGVTQKIYKSKYLR
ncbi:hypothetical protein F2Q68_00018607 [Brassica cretica]|uniref:RelA/SpoT domain-containing protein n=1 Tax=Brassica cretica TaxID=69181 RepID=A0A8S9FQ80_BRACR|nr:hypothetical protein F2Q68_00018607 [Brassica cretica]